MVGVYSDSFDEERGLSVLDRDQSDQDRTQVEFGSNSDGLRFDVQGRLLFRLVVGIGTGVGTCSP